MSPTDGATMGQPSGRLNAAAINVRDCREAPILIAGEECRRCGSNPGIPRGGTRKDPTVVRLLARVVGRHEIAPYRHV